MAATGVAIINVSSMNLFDEVEKLGHGAFGVVYLVKDKATGKPYVVKTVNMALVAAKAMGDSELERKLEAMVFQEANLMKDEIDHDNVVKVHASFIDSGNFHILMEYCDGGTLKKAIDEKKTADSLFSEEQICHWMAQISMALGWIHERKILHRDIKSENIFLMGEDRQTVKLGDFGIARKLEDPTKGAFTVIGTVSHMPIEVLSGDGYSFKSEVWAFGVVAYELATLKLPYQCAFQREGFESISGDIYSVKLRRLIEARMLVNDIKQRATMAQINDDPCLQPYVKKCLKAKAKAAEHKALLDKIARHEAILTNAETRAAYFEQQFKQSQQANEEASRKIAFLEARLLQDQEKELGNDAIKNASSMGCFVQERRLGSGTYLVKDKATSRSCVVKKIDMATVFGGESSASSDAKEFEKVIFHEADLIKEIDHDNIIRVFAFFMECNQFHVVIEYCGGVTLKEMVSKKKRQEGFFAEEQICHWMTQIALALAWLDHRGIIYGDLKIGKIFVVGGDQQLIKVSILPVENLLTKDPESPFQNLPKNMAPEVLSGESEYSFKAVVWAFGTVAYELATLNHPFPGRNFFPLLNAIVNAQIAPISSADGRYSQALRDLIEKRMLVRDIDQRATIIEVKDDLCLQSYVKRLKAKAETRQLERVEAERRALIEFVRLDEARKQLFQLEQDQKLAAKSSGQLSELVFQLTVNANQTELFEACYQGDTNRARSLLLDKHIDVNVRYEKEKHGKIGGAIWSNGAVCLSFAVLEGNVETVRMLITEFHPSVDDPLDKNGASLVHWAAYRGYVDVVRVLCEDGKAKLTARNNSGRTPLMEAIHTGKHEVVEYLLRRGAKVNLTDKDGRRALALVKCEDVKRLLKKYGTTL